MWRILRAELEKHRYLILLLYVFSAIEFAQFWPNIEYMSLGHIVGGVFSTNAFVTRIVWFVIASMLLTEAFRRHASRRILRLPITLRSVSMIRITTWLALCIASFAPKFLSTFIVSVHLKNNYPLEVPHGQYTYTISEVLIWEEFSRMGFILCTIPICLMLYDFIGGSRLAKRLQSGTLLPLFVVAYGFVMFMRKPSLNFPLSLPNSVMAEYLLAICLTSISVFIFRRRQSYIT